MVMKPRLRPVLAVIVLCTSCLELGVEDPSETTSSSSGSGGENPASSSSSSSSSSGDVSGSSTGAGGDGQGGNMGGFGGMGATGGTGNVGTGAFGGSPTATICDSNDTQLIACFPFDGNTTDGSGKKNPVMSSSVSFGPGIHGQAASFKGTSQVSIAKDTFWEIPTYTLELWYYQRSYSNTRAGLFDSDNRFALFMYGAGELRCSRSGTYFATKTGMPLNTWTHIACRYDGVNLSLYVNGELSAQSPAPIPINDGETTTIGSNSPTGDYFDGMIDSVRVWNVPRSTIDICKAAGRTDCQ
jgi:hypothetical protein